MPGPKKRGGSSIPDLVCLLVLCGILAAGLWPFRRPRNAVTWLGNENGLRFGDYGTIWSSDTFQIPGSQEEASCSLEIWLQPGLTTDSNTLLSFSTAENPLQLSVHQYLSLLILTRDIQSDRHRTAKIGIEGVFRQMKPVFITITSGPDQTAMYVNGVLAHTFPQFLLVKDFAGQLVVGTSPVAADRWHGQLRGLAIYGQELTAAEVLRHYETWTTQGRPELLRNEQVIALYPFDEHVGDVVHNAVRRGIDLYIPERFSLLHQVFLEPFWKEYKPLWSYYRNILVNIVGFVPLGFFFCAYWSSVRPIKRAGLATLVLGLAVSLTIEVLQSYLPTRSSGTTDLITNTLGTLVGVVGYSKVGRDLVFKVY
jgi:VanZ like family/Concanavalin A-like lectin/glucanases superfamily